MLGLSVAVFVLRSVDQKELPAGAGRDLAFTQAKPSAKVIDDGDVAALFGLGVAHRRSLRRVREFQVGSVKWCEAVQGWRCGVLDAGRTEARKPGDTPHSAQDRRHCRRSPRVHDANLQTLHLRQFDQASMRLANFLNHDMATRWR
jgi:hypothetical protein